MGLSYVNINGDAMHPDVNAKPQKASRKQAPDKFHKGFKVFGIPPVAQEAAEKQHTAKQQSSVSAGKGYTPFDLGHWLMNCRKKAVRTKPYGVPDAAAALAELAKKSGWLAVEVREVKKGNEA